MKITKKKLTELSRPEKNVRIHSDKQIREFKRSVEMFGQIRPIVVDEQGVILAGNGLYDALTAMGKTEAECYVVEGLSESQKKKLMLADNRIFSLGVDDMQAFDELISELSDNLDIPGYDEELLKTLTMNAQEADEAISGYGIISDDTKAQMNRAAEKYAQEEENFAEEAEQYVPPAPLPSPKAPSLPDQEEKPEPLQRRYILCPHCGERIWM